MTGREKIQALIKRLEEGAAADYAVAEKVLAHMRDCETHAAGLEEVLPNLSDEDCEQVTHDWKD